MLKQLVQPGNVAFAFVMSCIMAFVMSGLMTALNFGVDTAFVRTWLRNDLAAWSIAFPLAAMLAPLVRRAVDLMLSHR